MIESTYGTMYYVDNMDQAVSFYKKTLGREPSHVSSDWTEFNLGGHNLCLHAKRDGQVIAPGGIMILTTSGVKTLFDKMKSEGYEVFGLHEIHPQAWSFHLKDDSGNEVSYYGQP